MAMFFSLGSGVVSWNARKQKTIAASSCEAEYTAGFEAAKEGVWLRALVAGIGMPTMHPTKILCDNNAAINLSEDPLLHAHIKHIDIKFHFLHECVQSQELSFTYVNTKDNIANILTKALECRQFTRLQGFLGLKLPAETYMQGGVSMVRSVESHTIITVHRYFYVAYLLC